MAKAITIESLANSVEKLTKAVTEGFAKTENQFSKMVTKEHFEKKLETEIEKLAVMTAKGFEEAANNLSSSENRLAAEINRLDIRLDQMAPNFDVKDLTRRVLRVETKLKIN